MSMLTEMCQELRNWFDRDLTKWHGTFIIENGVLTSPDWTISILDDQYFRIIGSVFNDGVHKKGDPNDALRDEEFYGSVWAMAVPPAVIALSEEINAWKDKYSGVDSAAMSPFTSESFGGYSYSKSGGGAASGSGSSGTWKSVFADSLNRWRKI